MAVVVVVVIVEVAVTEVIMTMIIMKLKGLIVLLLKFTHCSANCFQCKSSYGNWMAHTLCMTQFSHMGQ